MTIISLFDDFFIRFKILYLHSLYNGRQICIIKTRKHKRFFQNVFNLLLLLLSLWNDSTFKILRLVVSTINLSTDPFLRCPNRHSFIDLLYHLGIKVQIRFTLLSIRWLFFIVRITIFQLAYTFIDFLQSISNLIS